MQENKSEHFELKSFRNNQVSNRERRGDPIGKGEEVETWHICTNGQQQPM